MRVQLGFFDTEASTFHEIEGAELDRPEREGAMISLLESAEVLFDGLEHVLRMADLHLEGVPVPPDYVPAEVEELRAAVRKLLSGDKLSA